MTLHCNDVLVPHTRRVLYVSYSFPPVGGAGVQRTVKFTKYLPQHGWLPTILSVANPSVPTMDLDLAQDVRPDLEVLRARTFEPGYAVKQTVMASSRSDKQWLRQRLRRLASELLQPDPQVLWNLRAYPTAVGALKKQRYAAIVVTGPPFSSFMLGARLKRRFQLPLLLDFRDEWMLSKQHLENMRGGARSVERHRRMMESTLRSADVVLATTQASAEELRRCCREAGSGAKVHCVYNGFDPDDFSRLSVPSYPRLPFRLVYTGTLWNMTDASSLVAAVTRFANTHPQLAEHLMVELIGRRVPSQDRLLEGLSKLPVQVAKVDYLPHGEALARAASADALCLLLADLPGGSRCVPGKLFEYLATGRPIVAFVPSGETKQLLKEHAKSLLVDGSEPTAVSDWLADQIRSRHKERSANAIAALNLRTCEPALSDVAARDARLAQFSRPCLAGQLAEILGSLVDGVPGCQA